MAISINGNSAPIVLPPGVDEAKVVKQLKSMIEVVNKLNEAARQAQSGAAAINPGGTSKFVVSSYNLLGNSHTVKGGNTPGYASGAKRVEGVVDQLKDHDVDVVGLQEFQKSQREAFKKLTSEYDMVGGGDKLNDNVVAWRKDRFDLVEKTSVEIPYFKGKMRKMPVVKLQDKQTGKQAWFINVHNPAHPQYESSRRKSEQIENKLIEQLRKDGTPVFLVGDFNDRSQSEKAIEDPGHMKAADFAGKGTGIDWIFASKDVELTGAKYDKSQKKKTSDHPMAVATAKM